MDLFKKFSYWHFCLVSTILVALTKDHVNSFLIPLGVSKKYSEKILGTSEMDIVYPRVRHMSRRRRSTADNLAEVDSEDEGDSSEKDVLVVFRGSNRTFYMELQPTNDFVSDGVEQEDVFRHATGIFGERTPTKRCHYRGKVISGSGGSVALNLCDPDGKMSGMIVTPEGKYTIHPDSNSTELEMAGKDSIGRHIFMKKAEKESFCATKTIDEDEGVEDTSEERKLGRRRRAVDGVKVIQIAVFTDSELYEMMRKKHPKDAEARIKDLVMTIVNQVQLIYSYESMKSKFKIVLEKLRILKPNEDAPDKSGADIDNYLDTFCAWQASLVPPGGQEGHWDHAIMLTGLNLFKEYEGVKNDKVLGLAWVNGMCRKNYSCTINEGQDFEASYVIAHEMAHSLGVLHDGTSNPCDPDTFIMSDKTGPGKISWSPCSNRYLEKYFNRGQAMCLENDVKPRPELDYRKETKLPGEKYSPTEQCKMAMGDEYLPYITKKKPFDNICRELWCYTGTWATPAHPALEGSHCNPGMLCKQGDCVHDGKTPLTPRKDQSSGSGISGFPGGVISSSDGTLSRDARDDKAEKPGVMDRVSGFFKDVFKRVRNFFRTVG